MDILQKINIFCTYQEYLFEIPFDIILWSMIVASSVSLISRFKSKFHDFLSHSCYMRCQFHNPFHTIMTFEQS
jgi:hypothetical protein